uniref:Secreted protein n=1 Tax=Denticeps clupeoides TaxID=299321 RepID=A0AAY4C827_9TELE
MCTTLMVLSTLALILRRRFSSRVGPCSSINGCKSEQILLFLSSLLSPSASLLIQTRLKPAFYTKNTLTTEHRLVLKH